MLISHSQASQLLYPIMSTSANVKSVGKRDGKNPPRVKRGGPSSFKGKISGISQGNIIRTCKNKVVEQPDFCHCQRIIYRLG